MPVYFFHIYGSSDFIDMEGTELDDFSTAQVEAVRLAGNIIAERPEDILGEKGWFLDVTDATGLTLMMFQAHANLAPALRQQQGGPGPPPSNPS